MLKRRGLLLGFGSLLALPAIVRAGVLMPISTKMLVPESSFRPVALPALTVAVDHRTGQALVEIPTAKGFVREWLPLMSRRKPNGVFLYALRVGDRVIILRPTRHIGGHTFVGDSGGVIVSGFLADATAFQAVVDHQPQPLEHWGHWSGKKFGPEKLTVSVKVPFSA